MKLSCRSSASSVFNLLLTLTARPDQREGAECFLFFLLRKVLVSGFRRGEAPAGCRRVFSHPFTHEFPRRSQISGLLAGDVKESRNDNPTRDLQMAADRTRPHTLCGPVVSSLFSFTTRC